MCVICLQDKRLCASFPIYLLDPRSERKATESFWEDSKETVYFSFNVILLLSHSLTNCTVLSFKFFPNFLPINV